MFQCVAVCCSALQYVAVRCSVLQCVAVCCSALQCVAVRCSVFQCVLVSSSMLQCVAVSCSVLQCVVECVAVYRSKTKSTVKSSAFLVVVVSVASVCDLM